MRLVGYARQSKNDGTRVPSTAWQLDACDEWAKAHGHEIVQRFEDVNRSGYRQAKRPGFDAMLAALADKTVDGAVVWRLDRLSRQGQWGEDVMRFMKARGKKALCSVLEDVDTTTAAGELILGVRMSMAKGESEAISARWRQIKANLRAAGEPRSGGVRPFGLNDDRKTINKAERKLIREAARKVADGASLRSIIVDWGHRGIPTTKGNPWTAAALRQMLRSPRLVPDFLDEVTARRVRAVLEDPARRKGGRPSTGLLIGLLWCHKCGSRMRTSARKDGQRVYQCPTKPEGCAGTSILATPADDYIRALVAASTPELEPASDDTTEFDEVADITARLEQLARDHYDAGLISRVEYLAARDALDGRLILAQQTAADRERTWQTNRSTVKLADAGWQALSVSEQRAVVGDAIDRIVVGPAKPPRNHFQGERLQVEWR